MFWEGLTAPPLSPSLCGGVSLAGWSAGAVESCDTVIIATGFEAAHERWLDPGLLRDGAEETGVHMVGFNNGRYTKTSVFYHSRCCCSLSRGAKRGVHMVGYNDGGRNIHALLDLLRGGGGTNIRCDDGP